METVSVVPFHHAENFIIATAYVPVYGHRLGFQRPRLLARTICVIHAPLMIPRILTWSTTSGFLSARDVQLHIILETIARLQVKHSQEYVRDRGGRRILGFKFTTQHELVASSNLGRAEQTLCIFSVMWITCAGQWSYTYIQSDDFHLNPLSQKTVLDSRTSYPQKHWDKDDLHSSLRALNIILFTLFRNLSDHSFGRHMPKALCGS